MLKFFKKHIIVFASVIVAVTLLTVAFFAGGNINDSSVTSSDAPSSAMGYVNNIATETNVSDFEQSTSDSDKKDSSTTNTHPYSTEQSSQTTTQKSVQNSQVSSSASGSSQSKSSSSTNSSSSSKGNTSSNTQKDKYLTDPIPEGKPKPVEPQEQETQNTTLACTFSISCSTILNNMDMLDPDKVELVPEDGWILKPTKVTFSEGESVYDVLQRVCKENKIHLESSWTPVYNSAYIEGIYNLYEFDCGSLSGWMYSVNDWFPNYGCSRYEIKNGDVVEFKYTCNLGYDIGGGYSTGE